MRKRSFKRKLYLRRVERKREIRQTKRRRKQKYLRASKRNPFYRAVKGMKKFAVLQAPVQFTLSEETHRTELLTFINQIRYAYRNRIKTKILFSKVERLHPDGTLLFVSEMRRILATELGRTLFSCGYPRDTVVEQLFQHIGLLNAFGKNPRVKITAENVKYWSFSQGTSTDELEDLVPVHGSFVESLGEELAKKLFSGVSEAITNCLHHAYIQSTNDPTESLEKGWWLFTHYRDGLLSVAVCDLGIGIPRSVHVTQSSRWDKFQEYLSKYRTFNYKDVDYIRAAIDMGFTRTRKTHRGKGLPEMIDVAKKSESGGVRIYSNKGAYNFNSKDKADSTRQFERSIMGTLILWTLPVEQLKVGA